MKNKNITFSVVILSFNSKRYLKTLFSSIENSISNIRLETEIFIVDNGSTDGSADILRSQSFSTHYIQYHPIFLDINHGTTFSRNLALKKASGDFIIIMDSDAYMNEETLKVLKQYLEGNTHCGLVAPRLIFPDGRPQLSVDQFPTIYNKFKRFFFLKKMEEKEIINEISIVDYAISAFWMLPARVLNEVGLLDEKIFYSPEDVDYCIRIWKAGYQIAYNPETSLIHDAQEISRPKGIKIINKFTLSHIKGLLYLFIKHRYLFRPETLRRKVIR